MEYRCAACRRVLTLVPHGEGRYAPPGDPPPPPVPAEERRPPWVRTSAEGTAGAGAARERPPRPPDAAPPPLSVLEAYALLGVDVTTGRDELERAFRNRSLTCHPDKVAHLDVEFQALAEHKFKRLLEAFRLLAELHPS